MTFLQEFESPAWNLCSYCLLRKRVSFEELEKALNEVVRKNDALRMAVNNEGNAKFEDYSPRLFERVSFSDLSAFLLWAHERANESVTNFPGMWNAYLIEVDGQIGIYNIGHHIMCDALNVSNLYQMVIEELQGHSYSAEPYFARLEANKSYLQSRQYEKDRDYWEAILSQKPPLAFSGRPIGECDNVTVDFPFLLNDLNDLGLSEASVLYAATGLLLMRLQGLDSMSLGIPVLGRTTQKEMNSLGLFMHDLPMLISAREIGFIDFAREIENNLFDLFRHQRYDLPLEPLFDVSVDYSKYPKTNEYDAFVVYNDYVSTAMEFHFLQKEKLELTVRAQKGLFKNISVIPDALRELLLSVVDNPAQSIWTLPIAEPPASGNIVDIPDVGLYSLIEKQNTGKIIDGIHEHSLTDLRNDAEKISASLGNEKRIIGVLCERSYAELAAIYGIVRGGNAYLPISTDYPAGRIHLLLEQSKCKTVLVQRKYKHLIPDALIIEDIIDNCSPDYIPPIAALPDDPLYVIFTSGSTGTPKGAMVSNRSAINRIQWMSRRYFSADTIVMLKTPYTFDVSVWEIFAFAIGGFTLYILPPEDHYRQDRIIEHIRKGKVTDIHFVPTVFSSFLEVLKNDCNSLSTLKNIFLSGEALCASMIENAPAPVHNLYGPTECAVDVTYYDCDSQESDPVPIGRPIDNCQIYVLDNHLQPLPVCIVGQICIGGTPVGLGYMNDHTRTEQVFISNPYEDGKLYLTGDLGYFREDGQLVFVGRADDQVKIHGQRIELGEIEAVLNRIVPAATVVANNNRLIAFYTGTKRDDLRKQLSLVLPRYMIPSNFIKIDKMPLTPSGKVDRQALLFVAQDDNSALIPPKTKEEQTILDVVKDVLSITTISTSDNFYELGGDSLSSLFAVTQLQNRGYNISVTDFIKSESLAVAAEKIKKNQPPLKDTPSVVPFAPVIKAFLYEQPVDTGTFVQSCIIPIEGTEIEIRNALDLILSRHDMLRATFSEDGFMTIGNASYSFRTMPLPISYEPISFDIHSGPLVDAVLYPGKLKLTIHHFVVDAMSWTIIINEFEMALRGVTLPPKTGKYFDWVQSIASNKDYPWPKDMRPILCSDDPQNPEERYSFSVDILSNDIILTALGQVANELVGGKAGICVETHGRSDPHFIRTVGWFTAFFPFITSSLKETRNALSIIPNWGSGYLSVFNHLPKNVSILFNYISFDEHFDLGILPLFPNKINVNCIKHNKKLFVEIGISEGRHKKGIVEVLGSALRLRLNNIGAELFEFDEQLKHLIIDDVYDLTPTQMGIFRNWNRYNLKYTIELPAAQNTECLEKALHLLVHRHPILRSKFVKIKDGVVKQLILRNWRLHHDSDSLFRVEIEGCNLTIYTHHIILDGWSLSILARDLSRYLSSPNEGVMPTSSFGLYSEWIRSHSNGLNYWKKLLSGCGLSSDFPHVSNPTRCDHKIAELSISSEGIYSYAKAHHVTVNTVLETAFSLLLLNYNQTALFGKMVSGRNAPIQDINDIVGPFVNMVPVYLNNVNPKKILSIIQEQSIMLNEYGFTSLAELYANTNLKRINILFVFENYPYYSAIKLIDYTEENEFDLTISIRELDGQFLIRASYTPEKYDYSLIQRVLSEYADILRNLVFGKETLPQFKVSSSSNYDPPVSKTEETICKKFEQVLETHPVGRNDNFYDLGGTSLNMMELLCAPPLDILSPSEFMHNPSPSGLANMLSNRPNSTTISQLYSPQNAVSAYVLFPYGGGDAAEYTALVEEFRRRDTPVALYFVPWGCNYDNVEAYLQNCSLKLNFYSHCAGAVIAMKLLDRLMRINKYIAGASIPPDEMNNIWPSASDEEILSVLKKAGMPSIPKEQENAMIHQFRENTEEYYDYFKAKKEKTHSSVTLVLSKKDIFTRSYPSASDLWGQYIDHIDDIHFINCKTHYFQTTNAIELADILLKEI